MSFKSLKSIKPATSVKPSTAVSASRCLTLTAMAAAIASLPAQATAAGLADVVVTATRSEQRVDQLVADVTVLDRQALDRASGHTLSEVLAQQPGIQMSSNGGLGKTSSLFVRGLDARNVLLIVDGMRLGSATVGSPSFDNLPLAAIERIEIVRGPMSGLYGSDAVGGVIQVFTRKGGNGANGPAPYASVTGGSNRFGEIAGGVGAGNERWDIGVHAQHTTTRGFSDTNARVPFGSYNPDRDAFRQTMGNLNLGFKINQDWRINGRVLESEGTARFDDGPGADAYARLRNQVASVELQGKVTAGWASSLRVGRSTDQFNTLASASPFATLGTFATEQRQVTWNNTFATPLGALAVLGEQLVQDVSKPGVQYDVSSRTINAAAVGLDGQAGPHSWQASGRHDRNSQFGSQDTGRIGYGYRINPQWRLLGSYGSSFVAPSFNQLYFPGFGSPNLQPETGKHGELGVTWTQANHSVRATWFDSRIRGYITSGPQPVNIPRSHIDGITLAYSGIFEAWRLGASYDHVDPRNDTAGSTNYGLTLPRRARQMARLQADRDLGAYSVGATLAAFGSRFDDSANTSRLSGFTTLDLRADWRFARDWKLGARLNNLANRQYETALGYNQPGREIYVLLQYAPR